MPSISKAAHDDIIESHEKGESTNSISARLGLKEDTVRRHIKSSQHSTIAGRELSYRENLNWAISAAGEHSITRMHPKDCPNNTAWFLYKQALKEPKDFMAKFGQVESKSDSGENDRLVKQGTKHSIEEIDAFLKGLKNE
jgi:predicted transcriptional regulator